MYLVGGHAFYKALALVMLVLIARYLGGHDFGRFAVAFAAVQLADGIADVGLSQVIVRESAGRPATLVRDLAALIPVKLMLGAVSVTIAVGAVVLFTGDPDLAEIALWLAVAQALSSLTLMLRAVFQSFERMEYEALSVSLEGWVRMGAVLFGIVGQYGVLGLAKLFALASFIVFAATLIVVVHRFVRPRLDMISWHRSGALLLLGVPFSFVWLLFGADHRLNTLLIARTWGEAEAGMFSAAMRLIEPTLIVPTMLTAALFPVVVRHDRAGLRTFRLLVAASNKGLLMVGFPLAITLWVAAPEIVRLALGPDFNDAVAPLRIAAPAVVLLFLRLGLTQTLLASGRWRSALLSQVAGLSANVVAAALLVTMAGSTGGAIAFLMGQVTAVITAMFVLRDDLDRAVLGEIARPLAVALPSALAGVALVEVNALLALVTAGLTFAIAARVVRVFTAADMSYIRAHAAPLASLLAIAVGDRR